MAFPTFLMGCLPTFDMVGYFATVLLIMIRLVQGFSVGGQLVGSYVYTVESAPPARKCFYGSFCLGAANVGTLLGCAVAASLKTLPNDQLMSWGWRLPFLSGLLVAGFGMWMRHGVPESKQFEEMQADGTGTKSPLKDTFTKHWRQTLLVLAATAIWSGGFYISVVFTLP
jgi:MHS family proline/betaine transporter-like MFS transporter